MSVAAFISSRRAVHDVPHTEALDASGGIYGSPRITGAAPDRIGRRFSAPAPGVAWCGDLTEILTDQGKLYLTTVIDLFSRRLLGHAMPAHHDAALATAALQMAEAACGGEVDAAIFHSDRGGEYTGEVFEQARRSLGVKQSMGRVGSALDNAVSESFNTRRCYSACEGTSPVN